jgi:hypothetical protein
MKRQKQKANGTFIHKKAVSKKLGISVEELNKKLRKRTKKLKAMEGK